MFIRMLTAFTFLAVLLLGSNADAHLSKDLLTCPVFKYIEFTHVPKFIGTVDTEVGMLAELYDVNADGKADIAVYSALMDGTDENYIQRHRPEPIFYELDNDGDELPDVLYIDPIGNADCKDLRVYSLEESRGLANWKGTRPDLQFDGRPRSVSLLSEP